MRFIDVISPLYLGMSDTLDNKWLLVDYVQTFSI